MLCDDGAGRRGERRAVSAPSQFMSGVQYSVLAPTEEELIWHPFLCFFIYLVHSRAIKKFHLENADIKLPLFFPDI